MTTNDEQYVPSEDYMRRQYVVKRMHDGATRTHAEQEYTRWLAAHDARIARLEAQADIRGRAVVMYRERAREAEARIKAVRELHQQSAQIRHVPRSMREGHDDDQPFHYCTGCDGARYPCATIRALDGDA